MFLSDGPLPYTENLTPPQASIAGRIGFSKSLSRFLCKAWSVEVGVDAFGVGEGELFEGLFPVGDDLAFD